MEMMVIQAKKRTKVEEEKKLGDKILGKILKHLAHLAHTHTHTHTINV